MAKLVAIESVKDSSLEERINTYAASLCEGNNKKEAYEAAGYSCATFSNAAVFHRRYEKEIRKEIHNQLGGKAGLAISVLIEIMLSGKSETARVKSAIEVLDRAGYDKTTKISVQNDAPKTKDELQLELQALLKANPSVEVS